MNKRKREESKRQLEEADDVKELGEAIEEHVNIDEDEQNESSEGSGDDLMQDMEK